MKDPLAIRVDGTGQVYGYACGECGNVFTCGCYPDAEALARSCHTARSSG